jgi:hypothetical protein
MSGAALLAEQRSRFLIVCNVFQGMPAVSPFSSTNGVGGIMKPDLLLKADNFAIVIERLLRGKLKPVQALGTNTGDPRRPGARHTHPKEPGAPDARAAV